MIHRPVTLLLVVLTTLAAVPSAVRLVGDHERRLLVLLVVGVPYAAVGLAVLLVVQVLLRRRRLALLTGLAVVLNVVWFAPLFVSASVPSGRPLTVMTANLKFGGADARALVALVRSHHVDVLATEELTPEEVTALRAAGLGAALPHADLLAFRGPDGSGLWSRYPLTPLAPWDLRFRSPGAVVHVPGQDVVVRVVHAYPPVGTGTGSFRGDLDTVVRSAAALPKALPAVVLGDFNATLDTTFLRRLTSGRLRDAGEQAGSGVQRTWGPLPGWVTVLDLDHVLVDHRRVGVRSTDVLDVPGSDHDAVVAKLVLGG